MKIARKCGFENRRKTPAGFAAHAKLLLVVKVASLPLTTPCQKQFRVFSKPHSLAFSSYGGEGEMRRGK
jgi:hypothetical protein